MGDLIDSFTIRVQGADGFLTCCKCGESRPTADYRKIAPVTGKAKNRKHRCKACERQYNADYRKAHPEKAREYERKAYENYKDRWPRYWLQRAYGLTEDDYAKLLDAQDGKCAICGGDKPKNKSLKRMAVDHDHTTGMVRGLLCGPCNSGLGSFGDDIDRLEAAIRYLRRYADIHS